MLFLMYGELNKVRDSYLPEALQHRYLQILDRVREIMDSSKFHVHSVYCLRVNSFLKFNSTQIYYSIMYVHIR